MKSIAQHLLSFIGEAGIATLNGKFPLSQEDVQRLISDNIGGMQVVQRFAGRVVVRVKGITTGDFTLEMPDMLLPMLKGELAKVLGAKQKTGIGSAALATNNQLATGLSRARNKFGL